MVFEFIWLLGSIINFCLAGGIFISMPFLIYFKDKPFFAEKFSIPLNKKIDLKLIFGASLFGMGWGAVGLCPGPAIASLFLKFYSIVFKKWFI